MLKIILLISEMKFLSLCQKNNIKNFLKRKNLNKSLILQMLAKVLQNYYIKVKILFIKVGIIQMLQTDFIDDSVHGMLL